MPGSITTATSAKLAPGLNEIKLGPWVPGLQNHVTICVDRAFGQAQVFYNDLPTPSFGVLKWVDGKDTVTFPIKCGGNYS